MLEPKRPLKVFLCHASQDKPVIRELSRHLVGEGWIDTWLDEKKLLPGQDWRLAIEEAVEDSDIVIICLSSNSVSKEGHVQKELRYAREIALEKPEGTIFIIPLRLDECEVPRGLRFYQWVDYFGENKDDSYSALIESLKLRYEQKIQLEEAERARKEKIKREAVEKAEHEAAEKATREKAEKEATEKARLEAEELAKQKAAKEKAKRETDEKVLREKIERKAVERATPKVAIVFPEEKRIESLTPKFEKPESKKINSWRKSSVIITLSTIGLVGIVCIISLGVLIAKNFPAIYPTAVPSFTSSPPVATFTVTPTIMPSATVFVDHGVPMALIPEGTFTMGSNVGADNEYPEHRVYLNDFYIDSYEVTNDLYAEFLNRNYADTTISNGFVLYKGNQIYYLDQSNDDRIIFDGASFNVKSDYLNYPVVLTWYGANAYCEWRGAKLPTEAQWEKTLRTSNNFTNPWGNGVYECSQANLMDCQRGVLPVGSYGGGSYGIYDLVGNVWEWVADWYSDTYYQFLPENVLNPPGPDDGVEHVIRGGSWLNMSSEITFSMRSHTPPSFNSAFLINSAIAGFRCVRDVNP
jgi:formylglycine-generating enzyme required for sulfatase activity